MISKHKMHKEQQDLTKNGLCCGQGLLYVCSWTASNTAWLEHWQHKQAKVDSTSKQT